MWRIFITVPIKEGVDSAERFYDTENRKYDDK